MCHFYQKMQCWYIFQKNDNKNYIEYSVSIKDKKMLSMQINCWETRSKSQKKKSEPQYILLYYDKKNLIEPQKS